MADTKISLLDATNVAALKAKLGLPSHTLVVRRDSNLSVSTGTVTGIPWDAEESDPQSIFTVTAAFVTIPVGATECQGWVNNVQFAANSTGERIVWVEEATTTPTRVKILDIVEVPNNTNSFAWYMGLSWGWRPVTAANRIYAYLYQGSGGPLNLVSSSDSRPAMRLEFR